MVQRERDEGMWYENDKTQRNTKGWKDAAEKWGKKRLVATLWLSTMVTQKG